MQVSYTGYLHILYTRARRGARYGTDDSGMCLVGRLLVVVSIVVLVMTVFDRTLKFRQASPSAATTSAAARACERSAMTGLVKRAWVPLVMVVVVVIAAFTVARLHGIFGSNMYTPRVPCPHVSAP